MKRSIFLSILCAALATAACTGTSEEKWGNGNMDGLPGIENSTLSVETESGIILPAKGGIFQIGCSVDNPSPIGYVEPKSDADWITDLVVTDGSGSSDAKWTGSVSFRYADNEVFDTDRDATITISYRTDSEDGPAKVKTVAVKQLSNARPEPELEADTTPIAASYKGGEFSVAYGLYWPVEGIELTASSEEAWITGITVEADKVSFSISENKTLSPRSGSLKICYASLTEEVVVSQEAAPTPVLSIDTTAQSFGEDGGTGSIAYSIENPLETVVPEVSANVDWISGFSIGSEAITFTVAESTQTEERTGTITVSFNGKDYKITVTQAAAKEWETLGTGWFGDNYLFAQGSFWKPGCVAPVEIEKNLLQPGKYRLVNPYGSAAAKFGISLGGASDSYLVFSIDGSAVSFEDHRSGILFSNGNTKLTDAGSAYDKVVLDGMAVKAIRLSPKYLYESASGNGQFSELSDRTNYANIINIVFPGYSAATVLEGDWSICGKTDYISLEAISDGDYNVAITRYVNPGDGLDISGICKGTFDSDAGTLTFPLRQSFADTGETWNGSQHTGSPIAYSFRGYNSNTVALSFSISNANGDLVAGSDVEYFHFDKYVVEYESNEGYLKFKDDYGAYELYSAPALLKL